MRQIYEGKTRRERHEELVAFGIQGGIQQARTAYEMSGGKGRIHAQHPLGDGRAERVITGILEGAKGLRTASPAALACPIALRYRRAVQRLLLPDRLLGARLQRVWKRAYSKTREWLGGVVYEDPWLAAGTTASNSENPEKPELPYPRVPRCARP
ncbi:MAG: hypothetical protein M5U08_13920 [Burkholderiales bacterium]|nr:hypothetical protein [Burkholderiales bacterium]